MISIPSFVRIFPSNDSKILSLFRRFSILQLLPRQIIFGNCYSNTLASIWSDRYSHGCFRYDFLLVMLKETLSWFHQHHFIIISKLKKNMNRERDQYTQKLKIYYCKLRKNIGHSFIKFKSWNTSQLGCFEQHCRTVYFFFFFLNLYTKNCLSCNIHTKCLKQNIGMKNCRNTQACKYSQLYINK